MDKVIQWYLGLNSTTKGSDKANTCSIAWKLSFKTGLPNQYYKKRGLFVLKYLYLQ